MQNSLSNTDSAPSDSATPNQPLECKTERKKDMQDLRRRLKLQPFSSCIASIASAGETRSSEANVPGSQSPTNNRAFDKIYAQLDDIGQGSCGVVRKVLHLEENVIYAAKIMRTAEHENVEQMKREHQILSTLQHKNIIRAKEFFHDETTGNAQLVLEYFPSKNLEELIKDAHKEGRQLEEAKVKQIIQQVVSALKYVHEKGVCHRDITASNILVNEKNEVKLIDFSISRINRQELWSPTSYKNLTSAKKKNSLLSGFQSFMISNAGTDAYKAPEIVTGVPYNQSVDMWSLGVVTFYALAGYRPFRSKNADVLEKKISKVDYVWDADRWANISQEAILFVQACLKKMPFIRLSSKEANYHPWIKGVKLDWQIRERSDNSKRKSVVLSPSSSARRGKAVDREERGKFGKSYVFDVVTIN